ncbi:MAG: hypothetical protein JWP03_2375 [Phycisphaerales bacterium]|jgi:hypothetical protein|nr:hypothetical protein [Phycisphaerales bacterium]
MDTAELTPATRYLGGPRPSAGRAAAGGDHRRERMVAAAVNHLMAEDAEFSRYRDPAESARRQSGLADFLFAVEDESHSPDEIFGRLRWGGQFVYLTRHRRKARGLAAQFAERGFEPLARGRFRTGPLRFIPLLGRRVWYFVARKILLAQPREITERFTYHVQLARPSFLSLAANEYVVQKEVPSLERVIGRLRAKFADVPDNVVEKRALKFTEKIFPLFLTREAAFLKILQRDLPPEYRDRIPTLLEAEKDDRGYVRRMWMNWLRVGGQSLSQLEFARQSADLLRVVHDWAKVIHLDLRLDNFVITDRGVGFVDFGSAARVGENIQGNPLLSTLFDELMRTSQIQRMLYKMTVTGAVTSQAMHEAYGRVDKQVDLFYLAVQINQPHHNPDLAALVKYDPASFEAAAIGELTKDILKPADPANPKYRTAEAMLDGIYRIKQSLR